jgi:hypothetical protein
MPPSSLLPPPPCLFDWDPVHSTPLAQAKLQYWPPPIFKLYNKTETVMGADGFIWSCIMEDRKPLNQQGPPTRWFHWACSGMPPLPEEKTHRLPPASCPLPEMVWGGLLDQDCTKPRLKTPMATVPGWARVGGQWARATRVPGNQSGSRWDPAVTASGKILPDLLTFPDKLEIHVFTWNLFVFKHWQCVTFFFF